jgi:hypothetical protein
MAQCTGERCTNPDFLTKCREPPGLTDFHAGASQDYLSLGMIRERVGITIFGDAVPEGRDWQIHQDKSESKERIMSTHAHLLPEYLRLRQAGLLSRCCLRLGFPHADASIGRCRGEACTVGAEHDTVNAVPRSAQAQ